MKISGAFLILMLAVCISCEKQKDKAYNYMLTGIKATKGNDLVTVNIDTGNVESNIPVEYYVVGSTFFDNVTHCYG